MLFLFVLPMDVDAVPVRIATPVVIEVEAPVEDAPLTPTYNGHPIEIDQGVTLTQSDGFTVTMSAFDAARQALPVTETDDEYAARLCRAYAEAKAWLDTTCN